MIATSIPAAAREYIDMGWMPTPVKAGAKAPIGNDWQKKRFTSDEVGAAFRADANIGLLLGEPSAGLIDVDVDSPLALRLTHILPGTKMIHGREGNRSSHFWYQVTGAIPPMTQFKDPISGSMIIELRSTGGQTVVPPSRYTSGDSSLELRWESFETPGPVTADVLLLAVARVAAITMLATHWKQAGSRHVTALALAGTLLRGGLSIPDAEAFIESVCDAADDEEVEDRVAAVAYTAERMAKDEPATGATSLAELLDPKVVQALQKWLRLKSCSTSTREQATDGAHEWDAPMLFEEVETPLIPASLLPGAFGRFALALANAAEIPEALSVMTILGAISAAAAKLFEVSPNAGWGEPVNIYTMIVLPPANNKSLVIRSAMQPIDSWEFGKRQALAAAIRDAQSERKNQESQILSLRAKAAKETNPDKQKDLFWKVKQLEANLTVVPVAPQIYLNDVTPETLATAVCEQNGRIGLISDEGGIIETMGGLYSKGHANYDILLKGIDGGRMRLKRKDRDLDVNPILTIALVVQPQILRNMSDHKALQGRGLRERFLFVLPQSRLGYRTLETAPVPTDIATAYHQAMQQLLDIEPKSDCGIELPRRLTLAADAKAAWQSFRHEVEAMLRPDGKLSPCQGWGGKIVGFSLRIAGLMHVAEHGESKLQIGVGTMQNALTMARLLIDHALAAFGQMQDDQPTEDAKAVLAWITQAGAASFRRSDCLRKFHGRFTTKKRFDAALAVLIDRSVIGPVRAETTTAGKRGTMLYDVNPTLLEQSK